MRVQKKVANHVSFSGYLLSKLSHFYHHLVGITQSNRFVCCHYLQINHLFEMKPLIKSSQLLAYNRLIYRKLVKLSSLGDDYSKVCLIGSCRALFLENVIPGELLDYASVSFVFTGIILQLLFMIIKERIQDGYNLGSSTCMNPRIIS